MRATQADCQHKHLLSEEERKRKQRRVFWLILRYANLAYSGIRFAECGPLVWRLPAPRHAVPSMASPATRSRQRRRLMSRYGYVYVSEGDEDPTAPDMGGDSDEVLRDIFESLLRSRRLANAGVRLRQTVAMSTFMKAASLLLEIVNVAARDSGLVCHPAEYEAFSADRKRRLIVDCLWYQLPILQPQARAELMKGLAALALGETVPLLEKTKTGRRRASPARVIELEFGILRWIRYQRGRGRKLRRTEAEVAAAVNYTPTLLAKWKADLITIFGDQHIRDLLAEAGRT